MSSSKIICIFVHLFTLSVGTRFSHYCDLCEETGTHTMCLYPEGVMGPDCKSYARWPFTLEEKDEMLTMHNIFRNRVATGGTKLPEAADMREMLWDDELEIIAQRWTDQCKFEHDKCRDSERFPVGQNIGKSSASSNAISPNHLGIIVRLWFSEINDYNPSGVDAFEGDPKTGHFTQMIWSRSYLIGCGRVNFSEDDMTGELIACNYGPAGNMLGGYIYDTGSPCSACPEGTFRCLEYEGLCCSSSHQLSSIQLGIMLQVFIWIMM